MRSNIIFKEFNKIVWTSSRVMACAVSYLNNFFPELIISTDTETLMKI